VVALVDSIVAVVCDGVSSVVKVVLEVDDASLGVLVTCGGVVVDASVVVVYSGD